MGDGTTQNAGATEPRFQLIKGLLIVRRGAQEDSGSFAFPNAGHLVEGGVALEDLGVFEEAFQADLGESTDGRGPGGLVQLADKVSGVVGPGAKVLRAVLGDAHAVTKVKQGGQDRAPGILVVASGRSELVNGIAHSAKEVLEQVQRQKRDLPGVASEI
jgi:hypothetical protein